MKKLLSVFSLAILFAFQACEGPAGPPGPPGFDGLDGQNGEDGVNIVSEVFEATVDFTTENDFSNVFLFEPEIFPGDVVLTFIRWEADGNTPIWRALPQTVFFEEGVLIYNYDFTQSDFRLFLYGPLDYSLLGPEWTDDQLFRIVVVPGNFTGSRIDWTNYEAVIEFLNIEEEDFVKKSIKN